MEDELKIARIKLKDLIEKKAVPEQGLYTTSDTITITTSEGLWDTPTSTVNGADYNLLITDDLELNGGPLERLKGSVVAGKPEKIHTGGSSSYYTVAIEHPQKEGKEPYEAECIDVMRALNMTVDEVNAFKAIWRTAAARTLGLEKKGNNFLYDAQKVEFAGQNMVREYSRG